MTQPIVFARDLRVLVGRQMAGHLLSPQGRASI